MPMDVISVQYSADCATRAARGRCSLNPHAHETLAFWSKFWYIFLFRCAGVPVGGSGCFAAVKYR
jgi:hypothetical protein